MNNTFQSATRPNQGRYFISNIEGSENEECELNKKDMAKRIGHSIADNQYYPYPSNCKQQRLYTAENDDTVITGTIKELQKRLFQDLTEKQVRRVAMRKSTINGWLLECDNMSKEDL